MAEFTWFRLSHDWSERDDWLQGVSPVARLLWPVLLGRIRASNSAGVFRKPGFSALSRTHQIEISLFEEIWQAGLDAGEVISMGDDMFLLRDREIVMSPDAIRKEKEREEKKKANRTRPDSPHESGLEEPNHDQSGHVRTESDVSARDRDTNTNTSTDLSATNVAGEQQPAAEDPPMPKPEPAEPPPKKSRSPDERFERLRSVIARCHEAMRYDPPTVADVRREMKPTGPTLAGLLAWLEELPPPRWAALAESLPEEFLDDILPPIRDDAAVALWVQAKRSWRGAVSWPAVYAQRDALIAQLAGSRTSLTTAAQRADSVAAEMERRLATMGANGG